ncbi:hypothetical protein Tco_0997054, partial [Tanacetum coccineum]
EEDELPTPAASTPVIPDPASPSEEVEETKPFEEDEAQKSVRPQTPLSLSIAALVDEWLVAPTPPSPPLSPLYPLSLPLPRIPSPPLPSSPTHRDSIPEADLSPQKRARLSSPPFKIRESSAAAAAR